MTDIRCKAGQKIYALARVAPYMDLPKRRILMNVFFNSQFNYCQLVWMSQSHNKEKNKQDS